jgi:hypothetical protein
VPLAYLSRQGTGAVAAFVRRALGKDNCLLRITASIAASRRYREAARQRNTSLLAGRQWILLARTVLTPRAGPWGSSLEPVGKPTPGPERAPGSTGDPAFVGDNERPLKRCHGEFDRDEIAALPARSPAAAVV